MSHDSTDNRDAQISASRETIREWADEHGAIPVRHTAATEETEAFVLVPETEVDEVHERVEWDVFFDEMDERDYVVRYYSSSTAEPFHVMGREEALAGVDREQVEESLLEGETVRSTVTETTTVESVIVEEATVESELAGREVLDQRVVDAEPLSRECTNCTLVDDRTADYDGWFDSDRYLGSAALYERDATGAETETVETDTDATTLEQELPYRPELEVEERWLVTRAVVERFTVESRIADTDVTETDTIEDHDIDVSGLHQTIAETGILESDLSPDEVMTHYDIETEIATDDVIHTHFDRERLVEEEVVDRKRLDVEITGGDLLDMEIVRSEDLAVEVAGDEGDEPTGATDPATDEPDEATARTALSEDDAGKRVVDASGEEIGMVTAVEADENVMYVDAHPGITDRIKAAFDWGNADDDAFPVRGEQIGRITDDEVQLEHQSDLEGDEQMH
ncbi:hypothetical protein [Natrononativus amylolyticus]|uniref:hypothetical protein n=1 Tax=Natrononativus amylolyticus TaxID=2963434 RepID=UPI0020CD944E|nr:hypothetical protein [Natrononativus amylolyticus]